MNNSESPVSRRDALKKIGMIMAAGTAGYVGGRLNAAQEQLGGMRSKSAAAAETSSERSRDVTHAADLASASLVVGEFLRSVVWNGAVREVVTGTAGESLGPKSAARMSALEGGRIALLSALGGEHAERGREEWHEYVDGMKLIPVLVGLSDASTRALTVDPDRLLGREVFPIQIPSRPSFEKGSIEAWEAHVVRLEKQLVTVASDVMAVTSVLAPLGTTYASSAIGNHMKERVLRVLHEVTYAREVVAERKQSQNASIPEVTEAKAAEQTNELFNGKWGFSKLTLAMAGNIHGSWGIGDAPELFAAARHARHPQRLLRAHATGLINSEMHTVEGLLVWLQKAGIAPDRTVAQELFRQQATVVESLAKTLDRTRSKTDAPPSPIRLATADYLRIKRTATKAAMERTFAGAYQGGREAMNVYQRLQKDPASLLKDLFAGQQVVRDELITEAERVGGGVFLSEPDEIRGSVEPVRTRDDSMHPRIESLVEAYVQDGQAQAAVSREQAVQDLRAGASPREVSKTVLPEPTPEQEPSSHPEADATFLSHGAQEVLWALLTQVPVVAPASRLAGEVVPKMCGIREGEPIKPRQIKMAVAAYLTAVMAMSAFADNAAAYLFGEESLKAFFSRVYGEDVFTRSPLLADLVTIIPLKIAEQAGALTKVGNGPNFSQTVFEVNTSARGAQVSERQMTLRETFQNGFAQLANGQAFLMGIGAFSKIIDDLDREEQARPRVSR